MRLPFSHSLGSNASLIVVFGVLTSTVLAIDLSIPRTVQSGQTHRPVDKALLSFSTDVGMIPLWSRSRFFYNMMDFWYNKVGTRPEVRFGGSGQDYDVYVPTQSNATIKYPAMNGIKKHLLIGNGIFPLTRDYFHPDTKMTMGINFGNKTDNWKNAIDYAADWVKLVPQVKTFELGNEADLFVRHKNRVAFDGATYSREWRDMAQRLAARIPGVRVQAPGFSNTNAAQGFTLPEIARHGITKANYPGMDAYALHTYQHSWCSGRASARVDDFMSMESMDNKIFRDRWQPEINFANANGMDFIFNEMNTVSCGGAPHISDTFASALWMVRIALKGTVQGVKRFYFHTTGVNAYTMFVPSKSKHDNVTYYPGVRALGYGYAFLAEALAPPEKGSNTQFLVRQLPVGAKDFDAYAFYSNKRQRPANAPPAGTSSTTSRTTTRSTTSSTTSRTTTPGATSSTTVSTTRSTTSSTTRSTTRSEAPNGVDKVTTITKTIPVTVTTTIQSGVITSTVTSKVPKVFKVTSTITTFRYVTRKYRTKTTITTEVTKLHTTTTTILGADHILTVQRIVGVTCHPTTYVSTSTRTSIKTKPQTLTKKVKTTTYDLVEVVKTTTVEKAQTSTYTTETVTTYTSTISDNFNPSEIPRIRGRQAQAPEGQYLARLVVLNLQLYNTSNPEYLQCSNCPVWPEKERDLYNKETPGGRTATPFTVTGFWPGHSLNLFRLDAPGHNAKSSVHLSGFEFSNIGTVGKPATPEVVKVDANGRATFNIRKAQAVLLVDPSIK